METDFYKHLRLKSKIWLEDDKGQTVFGFGLLMTLDAIARTGSMNAAAREMKMGYRSLWGKIKKAEDRIKKPLLMKQIGGASGGSSELTPFAKDLIRRFQSLKKSVDQQADQIFHNVFESE